MDRNNAKDYLPLVQALADGKEVQIKVGAGWQTWVDYDFSEPARDYRIKPEPREKWFVQYKGGSESGPYADKSAAECYALYDLDFTIVCYREVIE